MRPHPVLLLAVVVAGVALHGCRLDLATDVVVDAGGGAVIEVVLQADPELTAELDALGVDPTAALAAVTDPGGWRPRHGVDDAGGLVVVLRRELDDVAGVGPALEELTAGLAVGDPGPRTQLTVERDARGRLQVAGTTTMVAPRRPAAELDGDALGPSVAELAELAAAHLHTVVTVTVPGRVVDHDGDTLAAGTVTWEVPLDAERSLTLTAVPPRWWERLGDPVLLAGGGALAVVLLAAIAVLSRRRR